jgi:predicted porin
MKKTLIALAAVAATGAAFAQSTVTIGGTIDFAAISNGKTTLSGGYADESATLTTKSNSTSALNQWTTSQLVISGTEDLGGGLKASFTINTGIDQNSLGNRDTNLALAGDFGTVRIGRFVPAAAVGFHSFSGAASTAIGSIYQITTVGAATSGLRFASSENEDLTKITNIASAGNMERNSNQIQYTSPNINGFTVNVSYGTSSTDISTSEGGFDGKSAIQQTGIHVGYVNGPFSAGFGINDRKVNDEGGALSGLGDTHKADLNWVGAAYDFGVARLSATHAKRKDKTDGVVDSNISLTSVGVTVPMDAFTFAANYYTGKNTRAAAGDDDAKLSGYQLSVRYALSKRTTIYALTGQADNKRRGSNTEGVSRKETGTMLGVVHTF